MLVYYFLFWYKINWTSKVYKN